MNEPEPLACLVGWVVGERADLLLDDLVSLPHGLFDLKVPGQPVKLVRTLDVVERIVPPAVVAAYTERVYSSSPYIVPATKRGDHQ